MGKILESFGFLFVLSLLLSGLLVNEVNGQCQKLLDGFCRNAKFDDICHQRCLDEENLGVSSCITGPGVPAGIYLCLCTYPCT